jgi:DNA-binding transcriptional ArsR family regulator
MEHVIWYLLAGTRGGEMRARILCLLQKRPMNANRLAAELKVDYKTVQHHLIILSKNGMLSSHGEYGALYFLSAELELNWGKFEEIWERIRQM